MPDQTHIGHKEGPKVALLTGQIPDAIHLQPHRAKLNGCVCQMYIRKKKKRKDYAFWRQFEEKPSVTPGCPGDVCHTMSAQMSLRAFVWEVTERLCLSHLTSNAQMLLCMCLQPDRALCLSDDTIQQTNAIGHILLCNMTVRLCKARLGNMRRTVQLC